MLRTISSGAKAPEISIHLRPDSIVTETGQRLRFAEIEVKNLDQGDPVIPISLGELGMRRIYSIRPQPIGEVFGVAWDGDTQHPALIVDILDAARPFKIWIEVWGL